MSLQEEIIKEAEDRINGFIVISGDAAFSDDELAKVINKILDAVEDQADSLGWVSIEAINKLRPEK